MVTRIGINGFGRIGRLTLRTIKKYHSSELEIVAVNDLADPVTNAHLLKWDSTYGRFDGEVAAEGENILVDGSILVSGSNQEVTEDDAARRLFWGAGADGDAVERRETHGT